MHPLVIGLALTIFTVLPSSCVYAYTNKNQVKSSSWFREKYLQQTYDDYYAYTVSRHSLEDNDIDICPDFEKSASIFAITSQHIYRISKTCKIYVSKDPSYINYTPPESYYTQVINVTVMDVIHFVHEFVCYTFEVGMLIISVIVLCCSTLFIGLVLFCQY
jgi:hypothetical protein